MGNNTSSSMQFHQSFPPLDLLPRFHLHPPLSSQTAKRGGEKLQWLLHSEKKKPNPFTVLQCLKENLGCSYQTERGYFRKLQKWQRSIGRSYHPFQLLKIKTPFRCSSLQ